MDRDEREKLRRALCERLISYSDDIHCIAVHRDLANDLKEAEALITILADDIDHRSASLSPSPKESADD